MKQIQLVGPVDKRAIAYPLFKLCDSVGKTLVITDDANFRRFSDNFENRFTLGRSDFIVTNDVNETTLEEMAVRMNTYDYVIYVTTNILFSNNDVLVYCHGKSNLICSEDIIDTIDELEHQEVIITMQKPKKNEESGIYLSLNSKNFDYIWGCEENKQFIPCKSPELAKLTTHLFAGPLNLNNEEVPKILVREV